MIGHLIGAAGGVELIITALAIRDQRARRRSTTTRPTRSAISTTSRTRRARACGRHLQQLRLRRPPPRPPRPPLRAAARGHRTDGRRDPIRRARAATLRYGAVDRRLVCRAVASARDRTRLRATRSPPASNGLIEAMKLFNEIKSDASGTVTRILAEAGTFVKRKQPILEIDPR